MNLSKHMAAISRTILTCAAALAFTGSTVSAAESNPRFIPQVMFGTAGVEPGLALDWRNFDRPTFIFRPEAFVSKDDRIGGGAAFLFDISAKFDLSKRHAIAVGPRIVYHNANHYGLEADAMVTWGYDIAGGVHAWQHTIGIIGAVGVIHDKTHNDNDLGTSAGIFYAFGF